MRLRHYYFRLTLFIVVLLLATSVRSLAQDHSIARVWIDATLHGVRNDFARPTVHARNLFHVSIAMYDTWALFDQTAETYLIGKTIESFESNFIPSAFSSSFDKEEVLSHAVYRLLTFRFANSPNQAVTQQYFDSLMTNFNYSTTDISIDYSDGSAISLGNFIASEIIRFGLMDGSNEQGAYENLYYNPVNDPLLLTEDGPIELDDPDRWQPLTFETFVDQSGNIVPGSTPGFLSPEWGNVIGFALNDEDKSIHTRGDDTYIVYHNPSDPPKLSNEADVSSYQWGFSLVSHWASQLDASDGILWDISPKTTGNVADYPVDLDGYKSFYLPDGGTSQSGHKLNPITNLPYEPQMVPRGDYARVLAEFWADGPDSETPPGHWFGIINYVMDQPLFEPKFMGSEEFDDRLEYDVKSYFTLGGAMHDAAITAWSIKGWHDYIRPISAIRYMALMGQSSDATLDNYNPHGIPLEEGLVEIISDTDPLASDLTNIGKIKLFSWKGHDYIDNPFADVAGVGWILAEDWWPYQRPTFVTPPFAGYISGHSTYSSAAAEILTAITGSAYFPGGMGEFHAPKDDFLVFEKGPSVDITLQWATYKDAADQCSLSRIWGGIHPPVDDIPGRIIGPAIAADALEAAKKYFNGEVTLNNTQKHESIHPDIYPNPVQNGKHFFLEKKTVRASQYSIYDLNGKLQAQGQINTAKGKIGANLKVGLYFVKITEENNTFSLKLVVE